MPEDPVVTLPPCSHCGRKPFNERGSIVHAIDCLVRFGATNENAPASEGAIDTTGAESEVQESLDHPTVAAEVRAESVATPPDHEVTLPPYTRDGYTECPKCKGQAKTFNCGCIRCDQPDCYYIVIDANCGAEFGYGSAGAPWM